MRGMRIYYPRLVTAEKKTEPKSIKYFVHVPPLHPGNTCLLHKGWVLDRPLHRQSLEELQYKRGILQWYYRFPADTAGAPPSDPSCKYQPEPLYMQCGWP